LEQNNGIQLINHNSERFNYPPWLPLVGPTVGGYIGLHGVICGVHGVTWGNMELHGVHTGVHEGSWSAQIRDRVAWGEMG
jgi:hypothetical protein